MKRWMLIWAFLLLASISNAQYYRTLDSLFTKFFVVGDTCLISTAPAVRAFKFNQESTQPLSHGYMYFTGQSLTIDLGTNIYSPITNGTANLFTTGEASRITIQGDSIILRKGGRYEITYQFSFSGQGPDEYIFDLRYNGASIPVVYGQSGNGTGNYQSISAKMYLDPADSAGSIRAWVKNLAADNDIIFRYGEIYLKRIY